MVEQNPRCCASSFALTRYLMFAFCFVVAIACGARRLDLTPRVHIPQKFRETPLDLPPNGEPERTRYRVAYEASWWNCVFVRAEHFSARCPSVCSGPPAAAAGCADGSDGADRAIDKAARRYGERDVTHHLQSLTEGTEGRVKLKAYFPNGPVPEWVR